MFDILIDKDFIKMATQLASRAIHEICLSTFKLEYHHTKCPSLSTFFQVLIERRKHGIKVNLLFNWNPQFKSVPRTNFKAAKLLKENGVDARYLQNNRCCHGKILIVDNTHLITGSHNLSIASTIRNFELSIHTDDVPSVMRAYSHFKNQFMQATKF